MAVPKKRASKRKTRIRKTTWKKKTEKQLLKILSIKDNFLQQYFGVQRKFRKDQNKNKNFTFKK